MTSLTLRPSRRKPTPFGHGLDGPRVLATLPARDDVTLAVSLTEHDTPAEQADPAERHCWHVRVYAGGREVERRGFDALRDAQAHLASLTAALPAYDDPALDDDLAWPGEADAAMAAASRGFELPEGGSA